MCTSRVSLADPKLLNHSRWSLKWQPTLLNTVESKPWYKSHSEIIYNIHSLAPPPGCKSFSFGPVMFGNCYNDSLGDGVGTGGQKKAFGLNFWLKHGKEPQSYKLANQLLQNPSGNEGVQVTRSLRSQRNRLWTAACVGRESFKVLYRFVYWNASQEPRSNPGSTTY